MIRNRKYEEDIKELINIAEEQVKLIKETIKTFDEIEIEYKRVANSYGISY